MDKDFIAPVEAERKMSLAKRLGQNVYMYGATGYGKTTLIRQYLRDDIYEYIDCSVNEWENLKIFESEANDKEINPVSTKCVVLDNTHLIRNIEQKQKVSRLLNRKDVWVILSARVSIPSWVKPSQMSGNLILVSEDDLKLSAKEIKAFAKKQDIKLSEEEAEYIDTDKETQTATSEKSDAVNGNTADKIENNTVGYEIAGEELDKEYEAVAQTTEQANSKQENRHNTNKTVAIVITVMIVLFAGAGIFLYCRKRKG